MADVTRGKIDRSDELAEDDPLYELTRIMGLAPARTAQRFDEFDLEIDLEKELLGEFSDDFSYDATVGSSNPAPSLFRDPRVELADYQREAQPSLDAAEKFTAEPVRAPDASVVQRWETGDPVDALELSLDAELAEELQAHAETGGVAHAAAVEFDVPEIDFDETDWEASDWNETVQADPSPRSAPIDYLHASATPVVDQADIARDHAAVTTEEGAGEQAEMAAEFEWLPADAIEDDLLTEDFSLEGLAGAENERAHMDAAFLDLHAIGEQPAHETEAHLDFVAVAALAAGPTQAAPADLDFDAFAADLTRDLDAELHAAWPLDSLESDGAAVDIADFAAWDQGGEGGAESEDPDVFRLDDDDLAPEIHTVDVPEGNVALADDLGIPEFETREEPATFHDLDDLDIEFSNTFEDLNPPAPSADQAWRPAASLAAEPADWQKWLTPAVAGSFAASTPHQTNAPQATYTEADFEDEIERSVAAEIAAQQYERAPFDDELDREIALPSPAAIRRARPPVRRGMIVAALVAGVAIAGGVGAFALSGGDAGSSGPVLVKADPRPMKVRPESPGGVTVPNQENKVYQSAAGGPAGAVEQETLLTTTEEPLDLAPAAPATVPEDQAAFGEAPGLSDEMPPLAADPDAASIEDILEADAIAPAVKSEERVAPTEGSIATLAPQGIAMPPRRVKTMVVKPDGTLAPREEPVAAAPIPEEVEIASADTPTGAIAPAAEPVGETAAPATEAEQPAAAQVPIAPTRTRTVSFTPPTAEEPVAAAAAPDAPAAEPVADAPQASMPDSGPIAPSRPSDQPVDIVGEVRASTEVASAPAAASWAGDQPAVSTAGRWAVQIASQPSEQAAQSSYQNLSRRYGSVIGGRPASIVKAEVAGKGTMWRVRVGADSKSEAQALCIQYKAAGGSCFVSK